MGNQPSTVTPNNEPRLAEEDCDARVNEGKDDDYVMVNEGKDDDYVMVNEEREDVVVRKHESYEDTVATIIDEYFSSSREEAPLVRDQPSLELQQPRSAATRVPAMQKGGGSIQMSTVRVVDATEKGETE